MPGVEIVETGHFAAGLKKAALLARPNVVFNLASSGVGTPATETELLVGNPELVADLLKALDPGVTKLVVHAGSWSQYGLLSGSGRIAEDHPQHAITPYGRAKAEAETVGAELGKERGISFVTLRLFNVFGPGEAEHRLIPYIVRAITSGQPAQLTPGNQVRDFVYVTDIVDAFAACAAGDTMESGAFNVASGRGTSVADVAKMTAHHLGADVTMLKFGAKKPRIGEAPYVVGNPSALSARTRWTAQVSVSDGVRDTVRWAMEHTTNNG